jgi:hypothetical protein
MQAHGGQYRKAERLRALRHLPPGARIDEPEDPEVASLLAGLRALPAESEPETWLLDRHGRTCARIALRGELEALAGASAGILRARAAGAVGRDSEPLARFADVSVQSDWPQGPMRTDADLARAVSDLRRDSGLATDFARLPTDGTYPLLAQLLAGESVPDPVGWIAENAAALTVNYVLGAVAYEVVRDFGIGVGSIRQVLHGDGNTIVAGELRLRVQRAEIGSAGILVVTHVTIPIPVRRPPGTGTGRRSFAVTQVVWDGFDELHDDLGWHYLAARSEPGTSRDQGSVRTYSLRQSFFPALVPEASIITLNASSYEEVSYRHSGDAAPVPEVTVVQAPLSVHLRVA